MVPTENTGDLHSNHRKVRNTTISNQTTRQGTIIALVKNLQLVASRPAPDDAGREALRCVVGMVPAEEGALFEVALHGAQGG